ncbi:hypothetical protein M011DRAFT_272328 [Sporormia fimetaria CBS 119925]|uniref:Uncharacterized protein n=1 Tax=Sporormia fimetaria CBS 119925 TaxID=1340428 RepID=A0A6A6VKH9_9PLEO|nr:hypothetical protein M011DRAFT_272328 [Sporormia fimetaria CBS 119925]
MCPWRHVGLTRALVHAGKATSWRTTPLQTFHICSLSPNHCLLYRCVGILPGCLGDLAAVVSRPRPMSCLYAEQPALDRPDQNRNCHQIEDPHGGPSVRAVQVQDLAGTGSNTRTESWPRVCLACDPSLPYASSRSNAAPGGHCYCGCDLPECSLVVPDIGSYGRALFSKRIGN